MLGEKRTLGPTVLEDESLRAIFGHCRPQGLGFRKPSPACPGNFDRSPVAVGIDADVAPRLWCQAAKPELITGERYSLGLKSAVESKRSGLTVCPADADLDLGVAGPDTVGIRRAAGIFDEFNKLDAKPGSAVDGFLVNFDINAADGLRFRRYRNRECKDKYYVCEV
jgi:hypothetical protein